MFAYCNNNPVMLVDPNGDFPFLILAIVAIVALTATLSSCQANSNNDYFTTNTSVSADLFDDVESAVKDFGDKYLFESIRNKKEYATIIYKVQEDNKQFYTYSVISVGNEKSVQPYITRGVEYVAVVHTHPSYSPLESIDKWFSEADIIFANNHKIPIYMFNKGKSLAVFYHDTQSYELIEWDKR